MFDEYVKAGKIASNVRKKAVKKVHAGMKLVDLAEWVESEIKSAGAGLSFPCNISVNNIASHYTPCINDNTILCEGDLIKIDLGSHINGYISDSAVSVVVEGSNSDYEDTSSMPGRLDDESLPVDEEVISQRHLLIEATQEAVENVLSVLRDGINIGEIGKISQETIESYGFKSVDNLNGHNMFRNKLHGGLSIPNHYKRSSVCLREGDVVAIEPYATNGMGRVVDYPVYNIFSYLRNRPFVSDESTLLLRRVREDFTYFPFALRHLYRDNMDIESFSNAFEPLVSSRAVFPYPVCREQSGGDVAQTEHTVIIQKDSCIVTTL